MTEYLRWFNYGRRLPDHSGDHLVMAPPPGRQEADLPAPIRAPPSPRSRTEF
jgi:hypothetical protein